MNRAGPSSFGRVALIGSGLIGGSFTLALKQAGVVGEVVAFDRDPEAAHLAVVLGIADRTADDIAAAVGGAELVIVAAPVAQAEAIFKAVAPVLAADALLTDVGSTKCGVIAAARRVLGDRIASFIPGPPIAGREVHGPEAAQAGLFRRRRVLLTPLAENSEASVARIRDAWIACGARVETIDAAAHDEILSAVSHLPHLLAFALVEQVAETNDPSLVFSMAGGGFRDFTRLAASSPEMWSDIAIANRDALLADLDVYRDRLGSLRDSIAASDRKAIEDLMIRARAARARWLKPT
jgi:prephenate dehydrogenase